MKKQLLLGSALLLTISAFPQNKATKLQPSSIINMAEKLATKFNAAYSEDLAAPNAAKQAPSKTVVSPDHGTSATEATSSPIISSSFTRLSGSMNLLGMIVSSSKPLHYHNDINTIAFIQRKSTTYNASPIGNSNSGTIVGYFSKNFGTTWDSTCIWANATNLARYPQGGIYNPVGNQNPDNAYLVGCGPVTVGSGWIGSWYASKKIGAVGTNTPGTDQQFMSHVTPFGSTTSPSMPKHYFPRHGFSSTDDGIVRSLGGLYDEYGLVTAGQPEKYRGTIVTKGSFQAGAMVWTADSLVPPTVSITTGGRQLYSQNWMAWNEAGTVGYVMFIGGRQGSTGSNFGWQPIIYKTTNSGNTWALTNGINFNTAGTWDFIKNSMAPVNTNSALEIPFFNVSEGIDMTVDKNNDLHIVSTVVGTARNHPDSMGYTWQFTKGTENYSWPFSKTAWPYIFDFIGDGANWTYRTIDSVGTEGPGQTSGSNGFSSNQWANASQTTAASSDMRIQVSRTYDGEFVLYSWAESDTTLTTAAVKWNEFPNIKQRAMRICDKTVSSDEYAISSPTIGFNARVRDKAFFHYMAPECMGGVVTQTTSTAATFTVPYTVSNNLSYDAGLPVDNFVGKSIVSHAFPAASGTCAAIMTSSGINSNEVTQSYVYPNPAKNSFNVALSLTNSKDVSVEVFNAIGQKVAGSTYNGQMGQNIIPININGVNAGVYFVKIKAGNNETTKKLILE